MRVAWYIFIRHIGYLGYLLTGIATWQVWAYYVGGQPVDYFLSLLFTLLGFGLSAALWINFGMGYLQDQVEEAKEEIRKKNETKAKGGEVTLCGD